MGIDIYVCTPLLSAVLGIPYVGINPTGPLPYSWYTLWRGSGRELFQPLRISYVSEMEGHSVHPMVREAPPYGSAPSATALAHACKAGYPRLQMGPVMSILGQGPPQPASAVCSWLEPACKQHSLFFAGLQEHAMVARHPCMRTLRQTAADTSPLLLCGLHYHVSHLLEGCDREMSGGKGICGGAANHQAICLLSALWRGSITPTCTWTGACMITEHCDR